MTSKCNVCLELLLLYLRWWRRDCLMNVSVLKDSCHKKRKSDPFDFFTRRKRTMIFYESPYRLVKTLTQFAEFFGAERPVSVCREISKIHEESVRGTLTEVIAHFTQNEPRGEIVIVLSGKED